MVEHEAPAKAGGEKSAAVADKVEDLGDILLLESCGNEDVSLAEFGGRVDPPRVRDTEGAEERERRLAAAQGSGGDGTLRLRRKPADRISEKPLRVRELLARVEIGGVADVDGVALAIERRCGREGARAVQIAVGEREGIIGKEDNRAGQRPAADINGLHAVEEGGGGFSARLRRRREERCTEEKKQR